MKEEINASHILIAVAPDADPKDTLVAYNKIVGIWKEATSKNFEKLAIKYSQDPSVKSNKGNLGYFTALQMVYPVECVAYNTKVGKISMPVRTKYGYHLVKVNGRRKYQGKFTVAHIMVRAKADMSKEEANAAKQKIDMIYKKLKAGEDWNSMVTLYTDDINSKNKNGELPSFSVGKMLPSFEEATFALKKPGNYSKPIQTPYGWHIIKLLDTKELESFEELEPTIKSKIIKMMGRSEM